MSGQVFSPSSSRTGDSSSDLLQLHIAEYEALMGRCNYFIALHVGLWGAIIAAVIGGIQLASATHSSLAVWLTIAGSQELLHIWSELIEEQYRAVTYIEGELRKHVEDVSQARKPYWQYERFLARGRKDVPLLLNWAHPAVVAIVLLIYVIQRYSALGTLDIIAVTVNILLLARLSSGTASRISAHHDLLQVVRSQNTQKPAA